MKTVLVDHRRLPDGARLVREKLLEAGITVTEKAPGDFADALREADFLTVLGGDGSVLADSPAAIAAGKPVLCVNHGTLGYLSCLESGETDLLLRLADGLRTEERMTADATVFRGGEAIAEFTALNEIVVSKGAVSRLIGLELRCNRSLVGTYRADGLIVSTPTGSTAYNLSAGGPVIDTRLEALTVCPVCSHSLSGQRAMVFSPDSLIEIMPLEGNRGETVLTADGSATMVLLEGDRVTVRRGKRPLKLVVLREDSFFGVLNRKMAQ